MLLRQGTALGMLDAMWPPPSTFDLAAPDARHAVCFRPTPMHLRSAGLAPGFDRLLGVREGRVDVAIEG
ncbi:MAG: hypothetical protein JWN48_816 [Myxococcaceae bacterium]|nr:hypothetical protein [Myxococcaceae bacterium]